MYVDRMNYLEVHEYLKEKDTVVLVCGSLENHGKHNPLGTDTFIPVKIVSLMEELISDEVCIMPALPYGSTEDLVGFDGTVSLGPVLLQQVLEKICDNLFDYGFRHFVVINGHGGNVKSIESVGLHLYKKGAMLALVNWWLIAGQINPKWKGGHGGAEETAGVMAYDETLIKTQYLHEGDNVINDISDSLPSYSWNSVLFKNGQITIPRPVKNLTDNGWLIYGIEQDVPYNADKKWGTEMVEAMAQYIADFIKEFEKVSVSELPLS